MAEASTIVWSNYPPVNLKKKKLDSFNRKKNFEEDFSGKKSSVNTLPNGRIWCASSHLKASYRRFAGTTKELSMDTVWGTE